MEKRKFRGNVPISSDFQKIGEVTSGKLRFGIFVKTSASTGSWINFKLALLNGERASKANYWLAWSKPEKLFSKSRDFLILEEYSPGMLATLTATLEKNYAA